MLPPLFRFTQGNLQDYVDCPRRFQLRYVQGQAWPGVVAEPFLEQEQHLERGAWFHRLVERYQLGVDADLLAASIADPQVRAWWEAYLAFDWVHELEGARYPELGVDVELDGYRFAAKYDLLVDVPDGRVVIFDWKTYPYAPSRRWFAERIQTRLYMLLVVEAARGVLGREVRPEQVTMVYWVAGAERALDFVYSEGQFSADRAFVLSLVREVGRVGDGEWPLAVRDERCGYCEFRSLCGRGDIPGSVDLVSVEDANSAGEGFGLGLWDVEEVGF